MLIATGPQQFYEFSDQNVSTCVDHSSSAASIHLYGACFTWPLGHPDQYGVRAAVGKNLGQNSANTRHARARGLEAPNRGHLQALTVRQCSLAFARGHLQSALRATHGTRAERGFLPFLRQLNRIPPAHSAGSSVSMRIPLEPLSRINWPMGGRDDHASMSSATPL